MKVICMVLFNLFIENNASLNSLRIINYLKLFNDICEYCDMSNSNFISKIEILSFNEYEPLLKSIQSFLLNFLLIKQNITISVIDK